MTAGLLVCCLYAPQDKEQALHASASPEGASDWRPIGGFKGNSFTLVSVASLLAFSWVVGTVGVDIYMRAVRYRHETRVCGGDYLLGEGDEQGMPYMLRSGGILWWFTFSKGADYSYSSEFSYAQVSV